MIKGQGQITLLSPLCCPLKYLLPPSLDQYQTWCRGCPQWVDDPYWFSGHMLKGQGQTTLLSPLCCPLKYLLPPSLDQYQTWCRVCPKWVDDPYWFSGHMFKGQGQTTLEPKVLSTLYTFITCLLASDRFCSYREDKPEFWTMGGIDVSETFFVIFQTIGAVSCPFYYISFCSLPLDWFLICLLKSYITLKLISKIL